MPIRGSTRARAAAWVWRLTVGVYLSVSILRGWKLSPETTTAFQAAQFAPVLIGLTALVILARPRAPRGPALLYFLGIAGYLAVAVLSVLVSLAPQTTLAQAGISVLMIALVTWNALVRWRDDPSAVRADLQAVVGFVALVQIAGLAVFAIEPEWATAWTGGRFLGLFENANYAGVISSVSIVVIAYLLVDADPRIRGLLIVALLPLVAAIILSGSRTALVGCVAGLALVATVAARRARVRAVAIVVAVIATAAIVLVPIGALRGEATLPSSVTPSPAPSATPGVGGGETPLPTESASPVATTRPDVVEIVNDQSSGRLDLYLEGLDAWLDAPILGYGFKTSPLVLDGKEAHNLVLGILLETGIVGLLPFLVVIASFVLLVRSGVADLRFGGPIISVVVAEMTSSAFFGWGAPVTIVLWLVAVAAFYLRRERVAELG